MKPRNHEKARKERPSIYPERFPVPDERVAWSTAFPDYRPPYFVAQSVLDNDETRNPNGWADPEELERITHALRSFEGEISLDAQGHPLNVRGRTGIAGRGQLGRWGANFAVDAILTREGPDDLLQLLAIQRRDSGQWAFPGGMVDAGETEERALARELHEETSLSLDLSAAAIVYRGYGDDRRNTDNAWMETTAWHLHLDPARELATPRGGDDAARAQWVTLTPQMLRGLWANHGEMLLWALEHLQRADAELSELASAQLEELLRLKT